MRHSLLVVIALLMSSIALADLGEFHQKNCETDEVKGLMGGKGSCRIVIAPKKLVNQGSCMGMFMNSLPCYVTYIAAAEGAAMNLTCGTNLNDPQINQDLAATATSYNVATLINSNDGKTIVKNDPKEYGFLSGGFLTVVLGETPEIIIELQTGPATLTNVVCN